MTRLSGDERDSQIAELQAQLDRSGRSHGGVLAGRTVRRWYVATHPTAIETLTEALEILAIIRTAQEEEAKHG